MSNYNLDRERLGVLFEEECLAFDDVLLSPRYSESLSRLTVDIGTDIIGMRLGVPIISSPMDTVTESDMAISIGKIGGAGIVHRFMPIDSQIASIMKIYNAECSLMNESAIPKIPAIGVGKEERDRFTKIYNLVPANGIDAVAIDIANGHSIMMKEMIDFVNQVTGGLVPIIAGNVATGEGYAFLAECGANAVRVGIGGGSICKTRIMTGFGVPTLSSVAMASMKRSEGGYTASIIADGGIRYPSDLVKSIVAGADAVMCGRVLAGTERSPGPVIKIDDKMVKTYRGMASLEAQNARGSGLKPGTCAEGVSTMIAYSGSLASVIEEFCGGLRSAMTYAGASSLCGLREVSFLKVSGLSLEESHAFGTKI